MMTPIQRDTLKQKAAAEQAEVSKGTAAAQPLQRAMLYKLGADRKRLKSIQSFQTRDDIKRDEILPEYHAYVEGVLSADTGDQDEILMQVMIWAFDARDMELFDRLARYAVLYSLNMPNEFTRGTAPWLAESCAKLVLSVVSGRDQLPLSAMSVLVHLVEWLIDETKNVDMHDEVRAKLYHAFGDVISDALPEQALSAYQSALKYRAKEPVKKKIAALQKRIAETASQSPQGLATDGESAADISSDQAPEHPVPFASAGSHD